MPKQGERNYLRNIGAQGVLHAVNKPFSDNECGSYLMDLGAVLSLLPPPPARVLDLGVGTGWTSCFLARRGYEVVGQDICADMIDQARVNQERYGLTDNPHFEVSDYESMDYRAEFDAALFFGSLHHSVNEEDALRMVFQALRPGGVCLTAEPGVGHARQHHSLVAVQQFQVTERDMPATRIIRAARKVGFRTFQVYPHLSRLHAAVFAGGGGPLKRLKRWAWCLFPRLLARRYGGIVRMTR